MKKFKKAVVQEKNNRKIDSFLNGTVGLKAGSKTIPVKAKIRIPINAGYEPFLKPITPIFMYPNFPQFRQYQYKIALECITYNTLVCLPTGLGKTHIASVIMVNFSRWFPQGKIFFLAPTRPLVDQQFSSLNRFKSQICQKQVCILTGKIPGSKREMMYEEKKIFFSTPQTFENDLRQKRMVIKKIVLIIFDEAHRGVGDYSYANIVKIMDKHETGYRIVGLSATPGNCNEKVQEVITNLQIAKLIVKNEDDKDVRPYIMNRNITEVVIRPSDIILQTQQILNGFISVPVRMLMKFQLIPGYLIATKYGVTPGTLFLMRKHIEQNKSKIKYELKSFVYDSLNYLNFLVCCKQTLRQSGYECFKKKFLYTLEDIEDSSSKVHIPQVFWKNMKQSQGLKRIEELFKRHTSSIHPKIQKLRSVLVQFFEDEKAIENNSKVIIFAQLRATCYEIKQYINKQHNIKSQLFFGQAKTNVQTREGQQTITETLQLSQRQQKRIIQRYKRNEINTLISTSIGEQGLDIGEVDAIFCYDGGMSVIRLIQRMGRTGRKRNGNVYMLMMDGKQLDDYNKTMKRSQIIKKMKINEFKYYGFNPSLFSEYENIPIEFYDKTQQKQDQSQNLREPEREKKTKLKANNKQTKTFRDKFISQIESEEDYTYCSEWQCSQTFSQMIGGLKSNQSIPSIEESHQECIMQSRQQGTISKQGQKSESRSENIEEEAQSNSEQSFDSDDTQFALMIMIEEMKRKREE